MVCYMARFKGMWRPEGECPGILQCCADNSKVGTILLKNLILRRIGT